MYHFSFNNGVKITHVDFCNGLLYELQNTELSSFKMIVNAAVTIRVNMPGNNTDRIDSKAIELLFLSAKAKLEL